MTRLCRFREHQSRNTRKTRIVSLSTPLSPKLSGSLHHQLYTRVGLGGGIFFPIGWANSCQTLFSPLSNAKYEKLVLKIATKKAPLPLRKKMPLSFPLPSAPPPPSRPRPLPLARWPRCWLAGAGLDRQRAVGPGPVTT